MDGEFSMNFFQRIKYNMEMDTWIGMSWRVIFTFILFIAVICMIATVMMIPIEVFVYGGGAAIVSFLVYLIYKT